MIRSGTHTPGVDVADWGLPPNTALRIELPEPSLKPFLTDYHVLDSEGPEADGAESWLLPSWPVIRLILTDRPIRLVLGRRAYDPLPAAALYGPTSRAMRMVSHGGVTVGIGVKPAGWARLFRGRASDYRDRVTPLAEVMEPAFVEELVGRLRGTDQGAGVKPALDDFFAAHLGSEHPDEEAIRALTRLISDDETTDLATASERVGIAPEALRRLAIRYFGFPPKMLLIRTRFLRSFMRVLARSEAGGRDGGDYADIAPTYFDASHFLRDANRFLGTTPRRFLRSFSNPYPRAVLRARALVMAAARREGSLTPR